MEHLATKITFRVCRGCGQPADLHPPHPGQSTLVPNGRSLGTCGKSKKSQDSENESTHGFNHVFKLVESTLRLSLLSLMQRLMEDVRGRPTPSEVALPWRGRTFQTRPPNGRSVEPKGLHATSPRPPTRTSHKNAFRELSSQGYVCSVQPWNNTH